MKIVIFQEQYRRDVVALWHACQLTVPWNNPDQDIDRKMAFDPNNFLIGIVDEKVIASVMFGYDGHRGSVYYLAVHPNYQRREFGRQLMAEVEVRAKKLGCPKINLMVRSSNAEVIRFYQQLGYQRDDVICLGRRFEQDKPWR